MTLWPQTGDEQCAFVQEYLKKTTIILRKEVLQKIFQKIQICVFGFKHYYAIVLCYNIFSLCKSI